MQYVLLLSVTDNNHVTVPLPVPRHDGPSLASAGPPLPPIIGDGHLPPNERDSLVRIFVLLTSSGFFSLSSSNLSTYAVRSTHSRRRRKRRARLLAPWRYSGLGGGACQPPACLPTAGTASFSLGESKFAMTTTAAAPCSHGAMAPRSCGAVEPWIHGSMVSNLRGDEGE